MNKNFIKGIILIMTVAMLLALNSACSTQNGGRSVEVRHSTSPDATIEQSVSTGMQGSAGAEASTAEESGTEAKYYPSSVLDYKTAHNEIFDFWFDMPEDWKAFDRSENGDGYYIISDNAAIDIRVYGMYKTGSDEDFYSSLAGKNGTTEDYTFNDGTKGKKIAVGGSREYFVRPDEDTYICFYVSYKDDVGWFDANVDKLVAIAASLRTAREGPKLNSGENKIKTEDLKLGDITIDMPYEKVKELMKTEILKEETDKLNNKTIFYKDDTEINIVDNAVNAMDVTSSDYPTARGIKVGDDKEKVKELYGEPDNVVNDTHWGYTYDGYELLSIIFQDGKVSEILIDLE